MGERDCGNGSPPTEAQSNSARAVYGQATLLYEITDQKSGDKRLKEACHILRVRLPWELPKLTEAKPTEAVPGRVLTEEEKRKREAAIRSQRFGGYRAASY